MLGNSGFTGFIGNTNSGGGGGGTGIAHISITNADFEADGITYLNDLLVSDNVSIFWSDLANYIYQSKGEWQYVTAPAGIKILIPDFDANTNTYNLELSLKQITVS
jgi:hypothetical protein